MKELYIVICIIILNQSGFKLGDSCINQHIFVTHNIVNLLDECLEVRVVFLDKKIRGVFCDKVWHKRSAYQMQLNGGLGELLDSLTDFLNNRKQGVQLNNQNYE